MAYFPSDATEVVVCSISLEIESSLPHTVPDNLAQILPRFNETELLDSVIVELDDSDGNESSNKTATIVSI